MPLAAATNAANCLTVSAIPAIPPHQQVTAMSTYSGNVNKLWQGIVALSTDPGCGYVNKQQILDMSNRLWVWLSQQLVAVPMSTNCGKTLWLCQQIQAVAMSTKQQLVASSNKLK
jgi:hypothetical protein